MNIKVWTDFSKRENSTKQPSAGTTIDVHLKGPCSLHNPVFILSNPIGKYTYVEAFGEYYFVDDVINLNDSMCEVHCRKDTMATYKTAIGNTTAFIEYDESSNTEIADARLATKSTPSVSSNTGTIFSNFSLSGSVVATVAGTEKIKAYIIPITRVNDLLPNASQQIESLFPQPVGVLDSDFVPTVVSAIKQIIGSGNLPQNITDVRWMPFTISGGDPEVVYNGMYSTGIGASPISFGATRIVTDTNSIAIPWQFSDWRNTEPYTELYVKMPFIGLMNFPASSLKGKSSLTFFTSLDKISGDFVVEIYSGDVKLGIFGASTAVKIPIGNSGFNLSNAFTSIGSSILSLGAPSASIGNMLNAYHAISNVIGGGGSSAGAGLGFQTQVFTICHDTCVSPSSVSSVIGTPAFASKQIGNLSGYIKCNQASFSGSCDASDREIINSYLNTGFFYE